MTMIESKNNNKIKDLIRLRDDSKFRNDKSLFYIEGERIFKNTPRSLVKEIYVKKSKFNLYSELLRGFNNNTIFILDDKVYDKASDTINSQGIIATIEYNIINELNDSILNNLKSCIILDSVSDPGNLGTILRVAEAVKIDLIVLANNCCNIYNTKVIRASMSSIFRNNILISNNIIDTLSLLKDNHFNIFVTSLDDNKTIYTNANFKDKFVLIFGNEANGVSKEILDIINEHIYIPMKGNIESLNVSVSTSIILYEVMRQNNFYEDQ